MSAFFSRASGPIGSLAVTQLEHVRAKIANIRAGMKSILLDLERE